MNASISHSLGIGAHAGKSLARIWADGGTRQSGIPRHGCPVWRAFSVGTTGRSRLHFLSPSTTIRRVWCPKFDSYHIANVHEQCHASWRDRSNAVRCVTAFWHAVSSEAIDTRPSLWRTSGSSDRLPAAIPRLRCIANSNTLPTIPLRYHTQRCHVLSHSTTRPLSNTTHPSPDSVACPYEPVYAAATTSPGSDGIFITDSPTVLTTDAHCPISATSDLTPHPTAASATYGTSSHSRRSRSCYGNCCWTTGSSRYSVPANSGTCTDSVSIQSEENI